jgi:chromosome partitioning protein
VISCFSQKEEVSLSAHVAANLALCGYRVLCCDLDARAILTKMFGSMSGLKPSIYDMIRSKEPLEARDVIQKTYFPKIDLIPASVNLLEFEVALSLWGATATDAPHTRVAKALEPVLPDYDVVIVNTPYQLSYGMIAGLLASQGVLIPINLSRRAFKTLKSTLGVVDKLMGLVEANTPDRGLDFVKVLITRSEVMSHTDIQAASFLRNTLGRSVMQAELCKTDLMANVTASNQTIFDIEPQSVTRKSYAKVTEPIYWITAELEENISKSRGRIAQRLRWGRDFTPNIPDRP